MAIDALKNAARINVILGRNGSGKSRLLRQIEKTCRDSGQFSLVKYITPERGGEWQFDPNVEINVKNSPNWGNQVRSVNRYEQYRQLALAEFAALELGYYRRSEMDQKAGSSAKLDFGSILEKINSLLDNVELVRPDAAGAEQQPFPVAPKAGGDYGKNFMSSGESEAVALGSEIVTFAHRSRGAAMGDTLLLIDEPDVHLHPDLQYKLMKLLADEVDASPKLQVVIATHSTAIVSALSGAVDARVGFMTKGSASVAFRQITSVIRDVLPIFGAHPLSSVFNEAPILLVEGDDEERIWQQVVRSSQGAIKLWPCPVGGIDKLSTYENTVNEIAGAIYDSPTAYSLRDRDDAVSDLQDIGVTRRMRLNCRSSENLLLTNEVLRRCGTDWDSFKSKLDEWIKSNTTHPNHGWMRHFERRGYDRRNADLKNVRNILAAILGATRSWEVTVGQAIASETLTAEADSLGDYLGPKVLRHVLKK